MIGTKLFKALRKDKDFYYSYQANIAMAFKDEYARHKRLKPYLNNNDIHNIANNAAKDFLNLLIKEK
jgi:hypothetical protein